MVTKEVNSQFDTRALRGYNEAMVLSQWAFTSFLKKICDAIKYPRGFLFSFSISNYSFTV